MEKDVGRKCFFTSTRRGTLKLATGTLTSSLIATASVKAQETETSCLYFKLTNDQARNVRMTYDEDDLPVITMLERMENIGHVEEYVLTGSRTQYVREQVQYLSPL